MTVIDCSGTGRARGRAHGEGARQLVHEALSRWEEATLSGLRGGESILDYARRFLNGTGLIATMEARTPDLLEEVRGIAEGANAAPELVAAYNLMDEQWWYDLGRQPAEPGCSLVGLNDGAMTVLAQNMDLPAFMDGTQVVLRLAPIDGPEALVLSSAGLIGLTGVNSAGVAVCVNTLLMLRHDPQGLPVAAVLRHALNQESATEAQAVLRSVPHASGQHYAIADRSGVRGFECSVGGCVEVPPSGDGRLIHTNHSVANSDVEDRALELLQGRGRVANSRERLAYLDAWLASGGAADNVIPLLSDPATPICVSPSPERPGQTFGSVMFRMSEETMACFCLGKAGDAAWQEVCF